MWNLKFLCYKTPIVIPKNWDLQRNNYSFSYIYISNQISSLFLELFSYIWLFWNKSDIEMDTFLFILLVYRRFLRFKSKNSIFDDKNVISSYNIERWKHTQEQSHF